MIIKKQQMNFTAKYRGGWPFTVDEVAVAAAPIQDPSSNTGHQLIAFALIHNFNTFAISGLLESHGFTSLDKSGIWKPGKTPGTYHNLGLFFQYLEYRFKRAVDVEKQRQVEQPEIEVQDGTV